MKRLVGKTIGGLFIGLFQIISFISAQEVPWSYEETSKSHFISFKDASPLINGEAIEKGDYIGVFYDSGGKLHCAGYMKWGYGEPLLIAYGQHKDQPGFEPGQKLQYRVWNKDANCVVPVAQVGYKTNNNFPDEGIFKVNGKSRIAPQNFFGHIITVNYRNSQYCQGSGFETPLISKFADSVHFIHGSEELKIDSNSGRINLNESEPGQYNIDLASHFCLNRDQISIEILPTAPIGLDDTVHLCKGETKELDPEQNYTQYYWSTGDTSETIKVEEPGTYILTAVTKEDCLVHDTTLVIKETLPNVELPDEASSCDSMTMSVDTSNGFSLKWSNGNNGRDVTFHESGTHILEMESQHGCKKRDSLNVTISPSINFDHQKVDLEHAKCDARGEVHIRSDAISGGIAPFKYHLHNKVDQNTLTKSSRKIKQVQPGNYQLTIEDSMGCQKALENELRITHRNCDNPVLAPNQPKGHKYFFDQTGKIEIYNRKGRLIRTLKGPAEWHGRDESGRQVPMGSYQVLINGQQKLQITVIR